MAHDLFKETFSAHEAADAAFHSMASPHIPKTDGTRMLDVGCASGNLLTAFAKDLGTGEFIGVDISSENIDYARKNEPKIAGCTFEWKHRDYLKTTAADASVIISTSTLQLIETEDETLVRKIAEDLRPGGVLVMTMPYECMYNHFLNAIRSVFKALRSKWTDKLIFTLAKAMHSGDKDDVFLRERIVYMYIPIPRFDGPGFRILMQKHGLNFVHESSMEHQSLGQPKHKFLVFAKRQDRP